MRHFWERLSDAAGSAGRPPGPEPARRRGRATPRDYATALLAAALALLVRASLDPTLKSDHAFVISLMAVVYVSWRCGFGPGVVTLLTNMTATVYFFVSPRHSFAVDNLSDVFAVAAFAVCGVGCAALGHAQREARAQAAAALAVALGQKAALEGEVATRGAAEVALRQSAERFETLTEAIPQMVWTADAAGRVTYFNRRWVEFTGVAPDDAAGDGWHRVIHPDDVGALKGAWDDARRRHDDRFTHEFRIRTRPAGDYRWVLCAAVPLHDAGGAVGEWVGTLTDIEDRKRAAETLERLVAARTRALEDANLTLRGMVEERRRAEEKIAGVARELQRSNGELEQFAYVASHDLQEPLRKIQAFGDLLRSKFATHLPDAAREYVGRMQASAGRMSRLIEDLLAFSRVTTHARPFTRVDLAATLRDVLDDLEVLIEKAGARVDVGPLPVIDADPSQVRQLLQNLVGNALKFLRPGVPPVIRVWAEVATGGAAGGSAEACRVSVADNGIGFDEKYLGRIFQVFQRLHGRDEYAGTGVGLAICKKIVDRHRGTITARSRPDEGATFVVILPVRQPSLPDAPDPPTPDADRPRRDGTRAV